MFKEIPRQINDFRRKSQDFPTKQTAGVLEFNIADKPLANLYNAGFGILMIYLVFQLMKK